MAPLMEGGLWQIITICAIGAFCSWALREVEICRKLGMGYPVSFGFSVAIFAYVTLGIHCMGPLLALNARFWPANCIIISSPVWSNGWPEWWNWWLELPIWPYQVGM